jgi:hypothetical protein
VEWSRVQTVALQESLHDKRRNDGRLLSTFFKRYHIHMKIYTWNNPYTVKFNGGFISDGDVKSFQLFATNTEDLKGDGVAVLLILWTAL